jgi:hypothetical protein
MEVDCTANRCDLDHETEALRAAVTTPAEQGSFILHRDSEAYALPHALVWDIETVPIFAVLPQMVLMARATTKSAPQWATSSRSTKRATRSLCCFP